MWEIIALLRMGSDFSTLAEKFKSCDNVEVHVVENGYNIVVKKGDTILLEAVITSPDYEIRHAIHRMIVTIKNYLKK